MPDLNLFLLGTPRLEYKSTPIRIARRKAVGLAAYVALANQPQSRDVIASLLWPDLDEDHARSALRSTLRDLIAAAPVEWIHADRTTLAMDSSAVWVDIRAFRGNLAEVGRHEHDPEVLCAECVTLIEQATQLYQADFLLGYHAGDCPEFEDWQLAQREWLQREYADCHRRLSIHFAGVHQFDPAIDHARNWLAIDPLQEPAHRQLMRLYADSGQRRQAIHQYEQCVTILDADLASPPERETTQLYEAIQNNQHLPATSNKPGSGAARGSVRGTMPRLPSMVVGRDAVMEELKRRVVLGIDSAHPIIVIQGWPGVGKSTTAAMIAHDPDIARQFPDGILWTSLGESPSLFTEVSAWATGLGLAEADRARHVEDISAQLTAVLRDKRVLLIVDDVWQPEHVQPFHVGGHLSTMILTTRLNDVAIALAPAAADIYHLPVLTQTAGVELLNRLTPETVSRYPAEVQTLVDDLEGLPLAIHVAGRLLHSEARLGWGIRELLAELGTGIGLLDALAPSDMLGAHPATSPTVAVLLRRSTDSLDAATRERFALLGLFVPKPATFDLEAVGAAWDIPDPRSVVRVLVNRGLLEPIGGGRFQMHALLVMHARSLLEV